MSELELQKICFEHTKECMATKIKPFMEEIKNINKNLTALPEKLEERFDKRYADKQTQKDVTVIKSDIRRVVWMLVGVVILALTGLVIK